MKETYGVPVEEIQEAIKHGVRKINIDTDIRLAMTGAVRKFLAENPDKFDAARVAQARARSRQGRSASSATSSSAAKARPARSRATDPAGAWPSAVRQGRAGASRALTCATGPADTRPTSRSLPLLARGKVRDNYAVGNDRILMVASDRLSAFDVIMGEPIPGKGELLTQMALFWFDKLGHRAATT